MIENKMDATLKAKNQEGYQICTNCIMDTTDPDITFDDRGVCNHCNTYKEIIDSKIFRGTEAKEKLSALVKTIKKKGKGKTYDCLIGVSGGVDSTYTAYLVKELGLNPLAVHLDNGWNSELAVSNIEKVLNKLNIDLYTHVINWEEFRELQLSFLRSSTPDGEIPTDHGINALLFKIASENNIKYIISGLNFATESIMPKAWSYGHMDWFYINKIFKKFGKKVSLKSYPYLTWTKLFYYTFVKGIRTLSFLNYIDFDKNEALELLEKELGWRKYGGKHYESIYTRFFQSYILFRKFNIDKRRAHLSNLILAGQITRKDALIEIQEPICDPQLQKEDLEYTIKKFNISEQEFNEIMAAPPKTFRDYPNSDNFISWLKTKVNLLRAKGLYPK